MNKLKASYQNDLPAYKDVICQLKVELNGYLPEIDRLLHLEKFAELRQIAHTIRNIAGALGDTKLKIIAGFWEELSFERKTSSINEFEQAIHETIRNIDDDLVRL